MSNLLSHFGSTGAPAPQIYVNDVFSTWLRSGTGASATITTNIDLSTNGGLVWTKARSAATDHKLTDTVRGTTKALITDTTGAQTTDANGITAFSTTGYTVGTDTNYNNSTGPVTYVDWSFKQAANFFKVAQVTVSGSNQTVDLSSLGTVGMVAVKRTDLTSNWFVYHRSQTSGKLTYLNLTNAETTDGSVTLSGTTLTLVQATIGNGTYIVYAWAHDATANGIIQCGVITLDGLGNGSVSLGWEPQFLGVKAINNTSPWYMMDSARGFIASPGTANYLVANTTGAEAAGLAMYPNATGFSAVSSGANYQYIYLAIRRPNKPPTSGTQVYVTETYTGNGAARTLTGAGFVVDSAIAKMRTSTPVWAWNDRLRGATQELNSSATTVETAYVNDLSGFDVMTGVRLGSGASGQMNTNTDTYVLNYFRRAPGFFDVVCYTGTGANKTESHNLGVAPEFWIVKGRSGATAWAAGCTSLANTEYLVPNTTAAKATGATYWNSTFPTSTSISLGTAGDVNTNTATYVAYLFATLAGISKVGSYTGNGSSQTINCGFSTGARFILIKRTDSTGDWYVWDSVRGIVAGNDPHLSLNTTAAEVTTDDSIDPDNSGFIVNQLAATNINVNTATYIYLAIA